MNKKKENQPELLFQLPSLEETKQELKRAMEFKGPFKIGFLSEAECAPGTWKHLNGEISWEECQRLDKEFELQQAKKGLPY